MGKVFESIDASVREFIDQQRMFFVATSPLSEKGLINLSPKGLDTFRILDEQTAAYADLTGSGIETVAHLKENGRIVLMFCAFEGPANILRLHGTGEVIERDHAEFAELQELFPAYPGLRSIIKIQCHRISDSCGWSVPLYEFKGEREQLIEWTERKGADEIVQYQKRKNSRSIEGLPGILSSES